MPYRLLKHEIMPCVYIAWIVSASKIENIESTDSFRSLFCLTVCNVQIYWKSGLEFHLTRISVHFF